MAVLGRNEDVPPDTNKIQPTYRVTGLLLNFEFKYYNYKNVRAARQLLKSVRTSGVLDVKPAESENTEKSHVWPSQSCTACDRWSETRCHPSFLTRESMCDVSAEPSTQQVRPEASVRSQDKAEEDLDVAG